MKKLNTLIIICGLSSLLSSQATDLPPTQVCYNFAKIYMEAKTLPDSLRLIDLPVYSDTLLLFSLSEEALRQSSGKSKYLADVESANLELAKRRENWLSILCEEYDMPIHDFKNYERRYKQDISFQRSLLPCFEATIEATLK